MKKVLFLNLIAILLLEITSCNNQNNIKQPVAVDSSSNKKNPNSPKAKTPKLLGAIPTLPGDSPIPESDAYQLINNFQTADPAPPNRHPSSFLFNAKDLISYFNTTTTNPNDDNYLHIYLATDPKTGTFLVIAPSIYLNGVLMHDPTSNNLILTSLSEPNCCTQTDPNLDPVDVNNAGNCNGIVCNSNVKPKTINPTPKPQQLCDPDKYIKGCITAYQTKYPSKNNTQSFLINADAIKDYLLNPSPDDDQVLYIQVYLAIDPSLNTSDNLTIIMVMVDATGNHVCTTDAGNDENYVFNECNPCPYCDVSPDVFDNPNSPQYIIKNDEYVHIPFVKKDNVKRDPKSYHIKKKK